jgi:hypothetical protein
MIFPSYSKHWGHFLPTWVFFLRVMFTTSFIHRGEHTLLVRRTKGPTALDRVGSGRCFGTPTFFSQKINNVGSFFAVQWPRSDAIKTHTGVKVSRNGSNLCIISLHGCPYHRVNNLEYAHMKSPCSYHIAICFQTRLTQDLLVFVYFLVTLPLSHSGSPKFDTPCHGQIGALQCSVCTVQKKWTW